MPQLVFDDHPFATERAMNGHTLLAIDPERELLVRWPGVELSASEYRRLSELLGATPFLGQSVSVAEAVLAEWREPAEDEGVAVPVACGGSTQVEGERSLVRLLVPEPTVTQQELEVSTADGLVKAMPAPPGSRWVEYERVIPGRSRRGRRRAPRSSEPRVASVTYRLEGSLRPSVAGPNHPEAGRPGPRRQIDIEKLVSHAVGVSMKREQVALPDDDMDGRAERLVLRLERARPISEVSSLLSPPRRLTGPGIDCTLRLESVQWGAGVVRDSGEGCSLQSLLVFRLESERKPLLMDAIVVCETFRRRLIATAARRFGADAVPEKLSGKRPGGGDARDDHSHVHVLVGSHEGREIDRLAVWCPAGLTRDEAHVVESVKLPMLSGASIRLVRVDDDRFSRPARCFRSHTPFLPVRHPKRRRGGLQDAPAHQVRMELRRRGFPEPVSVMGIGGPWGAFRIVRLAKQGSFPHLGAHGFEIEFAAEVTGPIALGRNSHFGMGLFLPVVQ
jgi:CRISPR-associated protein Csb2